MNKSLKQQRQQDADQFNQQYPVGTEVSVHLPDDTYALRRIQAPAETMSDGVIRCRITGKYGFLNINNIRKPILPEPVPESEADISAPPPVIETIATCIVQDGSSSRPGAKSTITAASTNSGTAPLATNYPGGIGYR